MPSRTRLRPAFLAAFGLLPLIGCIGASDDREGSSLKAGTGGTDVNGGDGVRTKTQANREDKGDNAGVGVGTGRPATVDATQTGGLGEIRGNTLPGPGSIGARVDSPPTPPSEPAPK